MSEEEYDDWWREEVEFYRIMGLSPPKDEKTLVEFYAPKGLIETFDEIWKRLRLKSRAEALREVIGRFVGEYTVIPPKEPKTVRDLEKKIISIQMTVEDKDVANKMIRDEVERFKKRRFEGNAENRESGT